ncbi:MAG: hypothetical protein Q8K92_22660, partial [Leadbetterella sp.]|nr:hypothetical protein [Leadbetterella sp.]
MATSTEDLRRKLFHKFSNHLKFIMEKGFIPKLELQFQDTYICPVCLRQFSEDALERDAPNMLTAEDAPPASLGGRKIALTCLECNN